jgi:hypothetical protein
MADQLDYEAAFRFARALSTLDGFPRYDEAIEATASDLVRWCLGRVIEGRVWSAEAQAFWLVTEAREHWDKWKGTAALRDLFRARFVPEPPASNQARDVKELEKLYGKPDPDWSSKFLKTALTGNKAKDHANQLNEVRYQAIRDSLYYTEGPGRSELGKGQSARDRDKAESFWNDAMKHHNEKHADDVAFFRHAIARGDVDAVPPLPSYDPPDKRGVRSITQADFDALRKKRQEEPS